MKQTPYRTVLQRMQDSETPPTPASLPSMHHESDGTVRAPDSVTRLEWLAGAIVVLEALQFVAAVLRGIAP